MLRGHLGNSKYKAKFSGHDTFPFRYAWLTKLVNYLEDGKGNIIKESDKRRLEIEGGENYTPNKNTLQEIADSKNIILDTNSEAFKYFAELHTGTANWKNMTNGQKQLLLARFDSLPFFPSPTKLPLLRPRKFNREQFDAAYALIAGTGRANPNFISKEL